MPDEPAEHETIPPIRAALHAYSPRLDGEPDVARLARAVQFAWDTWHGSAQQYSRTGPMLPDLITQARATIVELNGPARREAQRVAATMYLLVRAFTKRVGSLDLALLAADRAIRMCVPRFGTC